MEITTELKNANEKINKLSGNAEYLKKDPLVILILKIIKDETGHSYKDINIKSRKRVLVESRQIVMCLLKKHSRYSLQTVADLFNRDHATALHAKNTITDLSQTDRRIKHIVNVAEIKIEKWKKLAKYKSKENETKLDVFNELLGKLALLKHNDVDIDDWAIRYIDAE